jgi:antitoxin (DNA-binding transcriptional repressor) of toxin-antitoxin stability system
MDKTWPVQDAKARFSELLRAAETEPQIITYRGEPRFEVRLKAATAKTSREGLPRWWTTAPKAVEFEPPPRKREKPRKIF